MVTQNPLAISEAHAQTQQSTSSDQPPPRKPPSARLKRLIGELGLRYRPSAQADLEAHAGALALLILDLIDVPEHYLESAIKKWVRESPFLPKASDLIASAQTFMHNPKKGDPIDFETKWNADLQRRGIFHMRWRDDNGQMKLESA